MNYDDRKLEMYSTSASAYLQAWLTLKDHRASVFITVANVRFLCSMVHTVWTLSEIRFLLLRALILKPAAIGRKKDVKILGRHIFRKTSCIAPSLVCSTWLTFGGFEGHDRRAECGGEGMVVFGVADADKGWPRERYLSCRGSTERGAEPKPVKYDC